MNNFMEMNEVYVFVNKVAICVCQSFASLESAFI